MKWIVIIAVVLLSLPRPFLPTHPVSLQGSYEAITHIVVGGIIGAWLANRQRWLLYTALAFSAVEVLSAGISMLR